MRAVWIVLRELLETLIPAVIIALLINTLVAQATQVLGQSMEPTLHNEQRLVVEKVSYHFHGPRRGDIVVLDLPGQPELLIKRVVGLPGESIEIRDGQILIDGVVVEQDWAINAGGRDQERLTVPPLHVFVLGDNRGYSNDSRNFGPVAIDDIVGRAWFSYWPPEMFGPVH